jgi:cytochrome c-type biogenesis protein CcmH
VEDYIVSRYGEFVLLKPRLERNTLLLWASPAVLLGLSIGAVLAMRSNHKGYPSENGLTPDERSKLEKLLADARGCSSIDQDQSTLTPTTLSWPDSDGRV